MMSVDLTHARKLSIGRRHWMVLVGAGLLMSMNILLFMAMGLMVPPLAAALHVGLGQAMLFSSINLLTGAALMATLGPLLMQRVGIRQFAIMGGAFTGSMLYCVSFVGSLPALYLLAAASGLFAPAALQMTGAALVNNWFIHRRGFMLGLLMAFASVGGLIAGALLPHAVEVGGWQNGFRIVGATTIVVAIAVGTFLIRSDPKDVGLEPFVDTNIAPEPAHSAAPRARIGETLRTWKFASLMAGLTLFSAMMALHVNFPPIVQERGISLAQAGQLIAMLSVANVFATLAFGAVNDRKGPSFSYVLSGALLLLALLVFRFTDGFGFLGIGVLVFSIPAITPPIITPIVLRSAFGNEAHESLLGIVMASMPIGIALGAPLWGLVKDVTGSYDVALTAGVFITCAVVALVTFALRPTPQLVR